MNDICEVVNVLYNADGFDHAGSEGLGEVHDTRKGIWDRSVDWYVDAHTGDCMCGWFSEQVCYAEGLVCIHVGALLQPQYAHSFVHSVDLPLGQ